jgi:hypothetical protein
VRRIKRIAFKKFSNDTRYGGMSDRYTFDAIVVDKVEQKISMTDEMPWMQSK